MFLNYYCLKSFSKLSATQSNWAFSAKPFRIFTFALIKRLFTNAPPYSCEKLWPETVNLFAFNIELQIGSRHAQRFIVAETHKHNIFYKLKCKVPIRNTFYFVICFQSATPLMYLKIAFPNFPCCSHYCFTGFFKIFSTFVSVMPVTN